MDRELLGADAYERTSSSSCGRRVVEEMLARSLHRAIPLTASRSVTRAGTPKKGHNAAIIELLQQHLREEDQKHDRNPYKIRAFASAIKVINKLDHPIRSTTEAKALKGVGAGILKRIQTLIAEDTQHTPDTPIMEPSTSKTHSIAAALDPVQVRLLSDLQLVRGIGPRTARQLIDAGCSSLADLQQPRYNDMLTQTMRKGLRFIKHLNEPVTRDQAEITLKFVREHISPKFDVLLAGSYRRAASTSSDIDVVLFHPSYVHIPTPSTTPLTTSKKRTDRSRDTNRSKTSSGNGSAQLLEDVVHSLEGTGLVAASFTSGPRRWQGIVRVPQQLDGEWEDRTHRLAEIKQTQGLYRRMDLNLVPIRSRGAAMLALTGDTEFNRHIRGKALTLGLHLNEFGLWRWQTGDAGDHQWEDNDTCSEQRGFWELVRAESEEEVLDELGMTFIQPDKRNFGFLLVQNGQRRQKKV